MISPSEEKPGNARFEEEPLTVKVGTSGHHSLNNISWSVARACTAALERRGVKTMSFGDVIGTSVRAAVREQQNKQTKGKQ